MLNKCSAPQKFVIVEMCEDILVDTVVLANFEFFSSTFKEVRVAVSDRYPVAERGWRVLGTFVGRNTREIQVFAVDNPLIWARYLRLEVLSHHGNEFYCPLTLLRIHGTTMMEEYKNQEKQVEEYRQEEDPIVRVDNAIESIVSNGTSESETVDAMASTDSSDSASSLASTKMKNGHDAVNNDNATTTEPLHNGTETCATNSTDDSILNPSNNTCTTNLNTTSPLPSAESPPSDPKSEYPIIIPDKPPEPSTSTTPTQESVYKQITKRLSLLEANATLSLRYIEEQSQLLRDVFSKMERRHTQKLDSFITELNSTLTSRMQFFVSPPPAIFGLTG